MSKILKKSYVSSNFFSSNVFSIFQEDLKAYLCSVSKLRSVSKDLIPLDTVKRIKFKSNCEMDTILDLVMNRNSLILIDLSNHVSLDDETVELLIKIMPMSMKSLILKRCFGLYTVPNTSDLPQLKVYTAGSWRMIQSHRNLSPITLVENTILALKSASEEGMQRILSYVGNVDFIAHQRMLLQVIRCIFLESNTDRVDDYTFHQKKTDDKCAICCHVPLNSHEYVIKFIIAIEENDPHQFVALFYKSNRIIV